TFAVSLLERLIEEHAKGDLSRADQVRKELNSLIGADITTIKPGSPEAEALKKTLMARGAWSPYLEVGIGPYAEIFTKAPPMAAVGYGAEIGIRSDSDWNNPEPEVTLVVNAKGTIVGATLGNDVNLRDMEGRSALLLGIAKDNNASCAIGPFVRLFDATFSLDDVRKAKVDLEVTGPDQFRLRGSSDLSKISRDPTDLVRHAMGDTHQYPDGMVLMTGTLFAPTEQRKPDGHGFTHMVGDMVSISSPKLGTLTNRVNHCDKIAPWTFGVSALMRNLASRGLLKGTTVPAGPPRAAPGRSPPRRSRPSSSPTPSSPAPKDFSPSSTASSPSPPTRRGRPRNRPKTPSCRASRSACCTASLSPPRTWCTPPACAR